MKKINSINYGGKVLGIGLMNMLIVPGILRWINTFLANDHIGIIIYFFFGAGVAILVCFFGVLLIEFQQDKIIDKYYSEHKNVKIRLLNETWECGACGSRAIGEESISCIVCGCKFENRKDKTPQEILKIDT